MQTPTGMQHTSKFGRGWYDMTQTPFDNLPKTVNDQSSLSELPEPQSGIEERLCDTTRSSLTPQQQNGLMGFVNSVSHGAMGVSAINCKGELCPYFQRCPLVQLDIDLPVGDACPVENALISKWSDQMIVGADITVNDNESTYDLLMIGDLTYYRRLEYRATQELADNPMIHIKDTIGTDNKGEPIVVSEMSKIINFLEKMAKVKMKLQRELIATRKSKSEEKANVRDRASSAAGMIGRVKERREQIKDAEYKVSDE